MRGESGDAGAGARAARGARESSWRRCHPLLQLRHDYADRAVELDVFVVDEYRGAAGGLEGQALKWVRAGGAGGASAAGGRPPVRRGCSVYNVLS